MTNESNENSTQNLPMKVDTDKLPFEQLESDQQFPSPWGSVFIPGPIKALILPDIHLPYHNKESLMISIAEGKKREADLVVINGDLADYYGLSKFHKDPRARRWVEEIKLQRKFFIFLRAQFPRARIIHKLGNHDERYELYLARNCSELVGLDTFDLRNVLELSNIAVELIGDKRPIKLGDLNLIHGHEYSFPISNPVNPARGLFNRAKVYAMCSHFHQRSEHTENNLEGKTIATWSTACLCDLHPAYRPINNWSNGFAFVEVAEGGKFHVDNKKIGGGGKIY